MNLFQRAGRSCLRKPVKSLLLLLAVFFISLLFLAGMASRSANIGARDSTRSAIGAGFLLEINPKDRSRRIEEASKKIAELYPDGQGSYEGYHLKKITVNGGEAWQGWSDNSFESLKMEDIETIAQIDGLDGYNVSTVPTPVKPENFQRIEDEDADQTNDFQGVALIGNRDMSLCDQVLSGNVTVKEGRMITEEDGDACVISRELAEKNNLQVGDKIRFHSIKEEEPVCEARIVGIYQVKERMQPYMSGDTFRSENIIFTDLGFPQKVDQEDPLYEKAYFKAADVDEYDKVKERIKALPIDWMRYDLIDRNGNLDTMAANFNDLEKISDTLLFAVSGAGFLILVLIFVFWIRNRAAEIGIFLALGIGKGRILLQILWEALIVGCLAAALSFLAAPAAANAGADYLAVQQAAQAQLQQEMDQGKVSTDYQAPELTVTGVETRITGGMLIADGVILASLITLSVCGAGILILRRKPRDILSSMS